MANALQLARWLERCAVMVPQSEKHRGMRAKQLREQAPEVYRTEKAILSAVEGGASTKDVAARFGVTPRRIQQIKAKHRS
jgi:transposase